ncbi:uncharacterized protein LOC107787416 [Nicotiana tabacum]|uniref:Uncharacterized protein LOC107787416 n=1 Tax=Nicotiana tabacum TaxID=4097 RepID=A0A1S3ZJ19_TOBAC|nr:PREDICTED: uncharacterized protein LOC107787416 [Nicotiana tabacum]
MEYQFRIFPWTIGFNPVEETSRAFVWISFLSLPPILFAKKSLMFIASAAGKPIAIDKATQEKSRPSTARVKVELDLLGNLPQHLKVQLVDEKTGKIIEHVPKFVYDNLPRYCTFCKHQGHDEDDCRSIVGNHDVKSQEDAERICTGIEKYRGDARQLLDAKNLQKDASGKGLASIEKSNVVGQGSDATKDKHTSADSGIVTVPVTTALARVSQDLRATNAHVVHGVSTRDKEAKGVEEKTTKVAHQLEKEQGLTNFKHMPDAFDARAELAEKHSRFIATVMHDEMQEMEGVYALDYVTGTGDNKVLEQAKNSPKSSTDQAISGHASEVQINICEMREAGKQTSHGEVKLNEVDVMSAEKNFKHHNQVTKGAEALETGERVKKTCCY